MEDLPSETETAVAEPQPGAETAPTPWPAQWIPADGDHPARLGGLDVRSLAGEYGTPLFALDLADLRDRMDAWATAASEHFAPDRGLAGADVYYASKAFTCISMIRLAVERGLCADVASGGELAVALAGGMDPARIGVHGNNKSDDEIAAALNAGVGRIVVDSFDELEVLSAAAVQRGVVAPVFVRVTTGVHAGANEFIATAHEDQKFGLTLADGSALEAARLAVGLPGTQLAGLHQHIGSQISDLEGHAVSTRALLSLRAEIARETGRLVPDVDLGGGYGITYVDEPTLSPDAVCARMAGVVRAACEVLGTPPPRISFEPGRNIVGPAMVALYPVGAIKRVTVADGERWYVAVDAGMSDTVLRPMLYGAVYTADVASRQIGGPTMRSRLVGKHCESGDILIRDLALPEGLRRGDLIAVPAAGAYGRSMSSNYNMLTRAPVVAVEHGEATVWIRRETIEDLLRTDAAL